MDQNIWNFSQSCLDVSNLNSVAMLATQNNPICKYATRLELMQQAEQIYEFSNCHSNELRYGPFQGRMPRARLLAFTNNNKDFLTFYFLLFQILSLFVKDSACFIDIFPQQYSESGSKTHSQHIISNF